MRLLALLLTILLLALQPVTAAAAAPDPDLLTRIDQYVSAALAKVHIPGAALALVKGDQIIHLKGFGKADPNGRPVTPETPFVLGSLSKSITATAVMQLVEQGKIDLDAPVVTYLPEFTLRDSRASRITVRHLLEQTSGLSTYDGRIQLDGSAGMSLAERVQSYQALSLTAEPGSRWQYSNVNYTIAGLLVERVAGEPFASYIRAHIFQPLDMTHSHTDLASAQADGMATGHQILFGRPVAHTFPVQPDGLPASNLIASAGDLAHYLIAQMNGGRFGAAQILKPESVQALQTPTAWPMRGYGYAMGWGYEEGSGVLRHGGDMPDFHGDLLMDPRSGWGVALLINVNSNFLGAHVTQLSRNLIAMLNGETLPEDDSTYREIILYTNLLVVAVLLGAAGLLLLLRRLRRGLRPTASGIALRLALPSLLLLLIGALLWGGIPRLVTTPWRSILLFELTLGYTLAFLTGFTLLLGLLHPVLGYRQLGLSSGPAGAAAGRPGAPAR